MQSGKNVVKKEVRAIGTIMQFWGWGSVWKMQFCAVIILKSVGEGKYHRDFLFSREKKCIFAKYFWHLLLISDASIATYIKTL